MIDYFAKWTNIEEAKQDAMRLRKYMATGSVDSPDEWKAWLLNQFLPDVTVWRPSQDTMSADSPPQVVHHPLAGWFGILALTYIDDVILNDASLQFALNRDFDPLASPKNLIVKNNIGAVINDIAISPIFAGSRYPIGGF